MLDQIQKTLRNMFSFSQQKEAIQREALLEELYTGGRIDGFDPVGWIGLLPDPDPVLRKTGDGIDVLRSLMADDKVISCIQNRKLGVLKKKDFVWEPGAEEGKEPDQGAQSLCRDLEKDLERVDLYNLFSQVLDAPYFGSTFVEILWRPENGRLRIDTLKPRPVEWFGFNRNHDPIFKGSSMLEESIPFAKIVIARHFPDAVNPYGLRLLSRCLWPIAIKKGGIRFWTTLCERFGMPWVIGKVQGDETERKKALAALETMVQNAIAVVSGNTEVKIETVEGKGGDLHPGLVQYCDMSISRALMGQNLTSENKTTGTYAESQTSKEALEDFQEADETLVVKFMRDLAWTYAQVNNPAVIHPSFRFREPEDYQAQADLDIKLHQVGVHFKPVHFERRYNLSDDEFEMDPGAEPKETASEDNNLSFADGSRFTPEQQAIEDMIGSILPEGVKALEGNENQLLQAVQKANTYEEAMENVLALYPDLDSEALSSVMERVILAADLFGQNEVRHED